MRLLVTDDEFAWAQSLAEHHGLTMSDVVRLLLREAHGALAAKTPKAKGRK